MGGGEGRMGGWEDGRGERMGGEDGRWEGEGWEGGEGRILNSSAPPSMNTVYMYKCKCNFVALQYLDITLAGVSIGNEILQRFIVGMIDLGERKVHRCRRNHMRGSPV